MEEGAANEVRRILLIRLSSLGDVLLATPIARLLRRRFPGAQIDVAVAQEFADVWRSNPRVSRVIAVDRGVNAWRMHRATARALAPEYDLVVDLQRNLRSLALRWGRARQLLRYSKHRVEKLALVYLKRQPRRTIHVVERYCVPLAQLGIADDGEGLELWLPEEREQPCYPPMHRTWRAERYIGIAPGARHPTKQWLPDRFATLACQLQQQGWRVVLLGSAEERELCIRIAAELDPALTTNIAGCSLYDAARWIDRCSVVVSNDSAPVHLAAARRVPVVVIYGSTVPELGFTPWRVPHAVVQTSLDCRPCTHIGRARCPRGHFRCMRQLEVQHVLAAVEALVQRETA